LEHLNSGRPFGGTRRDLAIPFADIEVTSRPLWHFRIFQPDRVTDWDEKICIRKAFPAGGDGSGKGGRKPEGCGRLSRRIVYGRKNET
jgi:hypothetical protein